MFIILLNKQGLFWCPPVGLICDSDVLKPAIVAEELATLLVGNTALENLASQIPWGLGAKKSKIAKEIAAPFMTDCFFWDTSNDKVYISLAGLQCPKRNGPTWVRKLCLNILIAVFEHLDPKFFRRIAAERGPASLFWDIFSCWFWAPQQAFFHLS